MILTITPNAAVDRVMFIDAFRPGTTMRPQKVVNSVGGKGLDVSVVLQTLGVENVALSLVAGAAGHQLVNLLDNYGITHDMVWAEGETRIAHVISETDYHRHSHIITPGITVSAHGYQALLAKIHNYLPQADWVVASGSLPPGMPTNFYHGLIKQAREVGASVLIDSVGPPLVSAISARPAILKMNRDEFGQTFQLADLSTEQLIVRARQLRVEESLPALVITCGADGILLFTETESYQAIAPSQQAVNAAGAGDAVSAVLCWRLLAGDSWPNALRRAAATAAAVVLTEGTADFRSADIERILPTTTVRRL